MYITKHTNFKLRVITISLLLHLALSPFTLAQEIEASWESLSKNYQAPDWFLDGKIGVWTHWGVPSVIDENRPNDGSHYGRRMYGPNDGEEGMQLEMTTKLSSWHKERYGDPAEFGYEDFIPLFKAENWDPDHMVKYFKENGARFLMPVATHHDNFDMYNSSHPWNSVKMGPKRDTIQEWKDAAQKYGLKFGVSTHLYWSPRFFKQARQYQTPGTLEWYLFNMEYDPKYYASQESWNQHWYDRCWELIEKYDPDMFNNDSPYPQIGRGKGLGVKLFSDYLNRDRAKNSGKQTTVLSFKDIKRDRKCFTYNCERGMSGEMQPEPWMWATDVSGGWFYRKGSVTRMSVPVLIGNAVDAISKNGIVMVNVALKGDGTLPSEQAAYIEGLGNWLKINGEGIYGSRPWSTYGEGPTKIKTARTGENTKPYQHGDIRITQKQGNLYVYSLINPSKDLTISCLANQAHKFDKKISNIDVLGGGEVKWNHTSEALTITPISQPDQPVIGFKISFN